MIYLLLILNLAMANTTVAIVDMGIDKSLSRKFNSYIVNSFDYSKEQENNIDHAFLHDGQHHGTFIAWLVARPDLNTKKIKLMDVVYSDYFGNMFNLNKYVFAENMRELYRMKKAQKDFSVHLSKVFSSSIEKGAKVINFSSGDRSFDSEELREEIKKNKEVFFVVSAGNENYNLDEYPSYPCNYDYENVICVGSGIKSKEEYSNYGKSVDLYAQGSYGEYEGTSFSTPIISRAISLIKNKYPKKNVAEVRKELFKHTFKKEDKIFFDQKRFSKKYE